MKNNLFFNKANEAWNIYAPSMRAISARVESYNEGSKAKPENETWREYFSDFFAQRKPYFVDAEGVAHIDIFGVLLFRETEFVLGLYGGTDYTEIMDELDLAESDDKVKSILLTVDSPGGSAAGNNRCAKRISNCTKPIFAHTDGLCCSAAYALACGANYLTANEDSLIGCIGTIIPMLDMSKFWEAMGIAPDYITNKDGTLKAETYPPSRTPEQKASLQEQVEDYYELFKSHVHENRNVEQDSMRGQSFVATRAKERGLIDEICSLKQAYANLTGFAKI